MQRDFTHTGAPFRHDVGLGGWRASLDLELVERGGRSVLSRCAHSGPLLVQRLFHPDPCGTAHVYLLHPPGGIAGGDQLEIRIALRARARALITTPAATKLYRSPGPECTQRTELRVEPDAELEWLPQETIVFDGARARAATRIELAPGARFAGWEISCLGRVGAGERFARGHWIQQLELYRDGRPLLLERLCAAGGDALLDRPWGLGGLPVTGTFAFAADAAAGGALHELARAVRAELAGHPERRAGEWFAASALDGALVCRYLGTSAGRARALLGAARALLRERALGRTSPQPRIWAT